MWTLIMSLVRLDGLTGVVKEPPKIVRERHSFSKTAELSMSKSSFKPKKRKVRKRRNMEYVEDSSSSDDERNEKMFQWMAMASLMDKDEGPNDAESMVIKELETQNKSILNLRGQYNYDGTPYNNRMVEKMEALEKKLIESKKARNSTNTSYFFNQMMMLMMMNPSK